MAYDEHGTWEQEARAFVENHAPVFEEHGDEAIKQAATLFALTALEAVLRSQKRKTLEELHAESKNERQRAQRRRLHRG
jgi:hypothetical protein